METAIATVMVAIISLIGVVIQTKSHNKLKSQEEILNCVENKLDKMRQESKRDDEKINKKIDSLDMDMCKRFLILEMTKIQNGAYIPNEEQKRMLYETKERYNNDGGDSYVDRMFENLKEKGLL